MENFKTKIINYIENLDPKKIWDFYSQFLNIIENLEKNGYKLCKYSIELDSEHSLFYGKDFKYLIDDELKEKGLSSHYIYIFKNLQRKLVAVDFLRHGNYFLKLMMLKMTLWKSN
ncbi:hypothetical protein [Mesomycoplasma lagogenitalium]|uniref:Uncharacterized protein n=1 Tax=Mesomycoplasma lagogenitalium TaxID=171286 RepID=A0ABY8LWZ3_9BACT|nr:hypothetical protein [Mesomycoplasma lagogenitalium]WGI36931.1 hypothetical protein QEG99_01455 [Mesomycoplasma lagogenitalium]